MTKLAIFGGKPVREKPFGVHPVVTPSDIQKVIEPFINNCFSGFRAGQAEGGPCVVEFENIMKGLVGSEHSIAINTWSNGLFSILLTLGIRPGDEVILPAYTMSACAASVLACGAVPVFADIEEVNYCIDPEDIDRKISARTKAIMVVHLFGMPADMDRITDVVKKHSDKSISIIEDAAQAPLGSYKGRMCGTIGDVGGFSFTESKHVMSGEGGIAVTDNERIANGLKYVRNHGEVCSLPGCNADYFNNMIVQDNVGFNFRLTELDAAIGSSQLSRLADDVKIRREFAKFLDDNLRDLECFSFVEPDYDFEHSYYCYTLKWDSDLVSRNRFSEALNAEGIPFRNGYCQPIYKQHIYRENPHWALKDKRVEVNYNDLPVTEMINSQLLVCVDIGSSNTIEDMQDMVDGIRKVTDNLNELI